jgi:hypothetical protein
VFEHSASLAKRLRLSSHLGAAGAWNGDWQSLVAPLRQIQLRQFMRGTHNTGYGRLFNQKRK